MFTYIAILSSPSGVSTLNSKKKILCTLAQVIEIALSVILSVLEHLKSRVKLVLFSVTSVGIESGICLKNFNLEYFYTWLYSIFYDKLELPSLKTILQRSRKPHVWYNFKYLHLVKEWTKVIEVSFSLRIQFIKKRPDWKSGLWSYLVGSALSWCRGYFGQITSYISFSLI